MRPIDLWIITSPVACEHCIPKYNLLMLESKYVDEGNVERIEDNARKFTLRPINDRYLKERNARSYHIKIDWIAVGEESEQRVVRRCSDDGAVKYLSIRKSGNSTQRNTAKREITESEYSTLIPSSLLHFEKQRYEFSLEQSGISFLAKYDVFSNGRLCILEIDADSPEKRAASFPLRRYN